MKVVLVEEKGVPIRLLDNKKPVDAKSLALRTRVTNGDMKFYELDFDTSLGMRIDAYVEALNMFPRLLNESPMIKQIQDM